MRKIPSTSEAENHKKARNLGHFPVQDLKKPENMANIGQIPKKTCGNRAFLLDFARLEAAL
jgi:hypothetical protein